MNFWERETLILHFVCSLNTLFVSLSRAQDTKDVEPHINK